MDFERVVAALSPGILVVDADFKIVWMNKSEEIFYNQSLQEMSGQSVIDCHKEKNRAKITQFMQDLKTGRMKSFSKTTRGMVITYDPVFNNNEFIGIVRTRVNIPDKTKE